MTNDGEEAMNSYQVEYIVREERKGKIVALYIGEELSLPFAPVQGVFLRQDSQRIWGETPDPNDGYVTKVTYDLDKGTFVCEFPPVKAPLPQVCVCYELVSDRSLQASIRTSPSVQLPASAGSSTSPHGR